jgi:hypothetical protein
VLKFVVDHVAFDRSDGLGRRPRSACDDQAVDEEEELARSLLGLRAWARDMSETRQISPVAPATGAADGSLSGHPIVPYGIVEGLMNTAVDHALTLTDACIQPPKAGEDLPTISIAGANFSILRPIIEALAWIIWILSGTTPQDRLKRCLGNLLIEQKHMESLAAELTRASQEDETLTEAAAGIRQLFEEVCANAGLDAVLVERRAKSSSGVMRSVASTIPGDSHRALRSYALASAHSHGQVATMLMNSVRSRRVDQYGSYIYAEPDTGLLLEAIRLIFDLNRVAAESLNAQGYSRSAR